MSVKFIGYIGFNNTSEAQPGGGRRLHDGVKARGSDLAWHGVLSTTLV